MRGAIRARTDSVHSRFICAPRQLTSRLSRSTPSSTQPFPEPIVRVVQSQKLQHGCLLWRIWPRLSKGNVSPQRSEARISDGSGSEASGKNVIMCLFMLRLVTHSIFFFCILADALFKLFGVIASAMEELSHRVSRSSVPCNLCRTLQASPGAWPQAVATSISLVSLATGPRCCYCTTGWIRSLDQCNSA